MRRSAVLVLLLFLVLVAHATASLAFADTAPPPAAQESNGLILGAIALGALVAVVALNRPRKPGSR